MEIPRTHEGNFIGKFLIIPCDLPCLSLFVDIEAQIRDLQNKKKEIPAEKNDKGVGLGESGFFDSEIYDGKDKKYEGYVTSIAANDEVDDDEEDVGYSSQKRTGLGAPVALLNDIAQVS